MGRRSVCHGEQQVTHTLFESTKNYFDFLILIVDL